MDFAAALAGVTVVVVPRDIEVPASGEPATDVLVGRDVGRPGCGLEDTEQRMIAFRAELGVNPARFRDGVGWRR